MSTTGPPLNLSTPASGTKGWGTARNADLTAINTAIAALQAGGTTGPKGDTGSPGPVGMIFAGAWQSTTTYAVTDVVTFNGSSYIAIAPGTNIQPDINPNSWVPIALAGAAGPQGPTGPEGPSGGGGSSIAVPVSIAQGGTAAITAAAALVSLGAAARGNNADITALSGIPQVTVTTAEIVVGTPGGPSGSNVTITPGGMSGVGSLTIGLLTVSGVVATGQITSAVPNSTITLGSYGGSTSIVAINNGLIVEGPTPACSAGQWGAGCVTASTATAGGGQAVPPTVLGYRVENNQGTLVKVPYFAM